MGDKIVRVDGSTNEMTSDGRPMSTRTTVSLRTAFAMVGAAVGIFFVGVYAANAVVPGTRGGHTRTALTVAGTLTGATGRHPTTFTFRNTASGMTCTPPAVDVTPTLPNGAFSAEVDIERCPAALFDGANVTVTAEVRDTADAAVLTTPAATINPVPYARYADHYGAPDCPVGYERVTDTFFTPDSDRRLCQKSRTDGATRVVYDEVVRVGTGASAFWVDRFEATVWPTRAGPEPTSPYGCATPYPAEFRPNGQWRTDIVRTSPVKALSRQTFDPSTCLTWFQANEACRAAGKRLPVGDEWITAAQGTPDPGTGDLCRIMSAGGTRGASVSGCVSAWGAQDMIGNASEWTAEWYAGIGDLGRQDRWPAGYGDDRTGNIVAMQSIASGTRQIGLPAAAVRGGEAGDTNGAGVFFLDLSAAPIYTSAHLGFRCVVPR